MFKKTTAPAPILFGLLAALLAPSTAVAQVEVDPFAYALSGFSLHIAKVFDATRLSVGTFGIDVPEHFHGNDDWSSTMRGVGVKWDYLGLNPDGFFTGLDAGYMRMSYGLDESGAQEKRNVIGAGVRAGYRLPLGGHGFYLAPWLSMSYNFDGEEVAIGDAEFSRNPVTVFPTLHLGWRF
jgi:hypothetical protein